jgi:hypothetical protein
MGVVPSGAAVDMSNYCLLCLVQACVVFAVVITWTFLQHPVPFLPSPQQQRQLQ